MNIAFYERGFGRNGFQSFSKNLHNCHICGYTAKARKMTYTIKVKNISKSATEKAVLDFFAFCGKIERLEMTRDAEGMGEATIVFDSQRSGATALLLTNSVIVDSNIEVVACEDAPVEDEAVGEEGSSKEQEAEAQPEEAAELAEHADTLKKLTDAGYKLGNDAREKINEYDEYLQLTERVKAGASLLSASANSGMAKGKEAANTLMEKVNEVDDQYAITETIGNAAKSTYVSLNEAAVKASDAIVHNEYTQSAVESISNTTAAMSNYVTNTFATTK